MKRHNHAFRRFLQPSAPQVTTMENNTALKMVKVKTTLPVLPYAPMNEQQYIKTERLLLRPLLASDLERTHLLRSQPEVMQWTFRGTIDEDLAKTKNFIDTKLDSAANKHQTVAICLRATGELIGTGGAHSRSGNLGWPELGYMLMRETWGKGYASEFLRAYLAFWWSLPRQEVEIEVEASSVRKDTSASDERCLECLEAGYDLPNAASGKVLHKCGFDIIKVLTRTDNKHPDKTVDICYCVARRQDETCSN